MKHINYLDNVILSECDSDTSIYLFGMSSLGKEFANNTSIKITKVFDNNGSITNFVGLPPRNVLICYAPLDRMEKQCCSFITDGEELGNNLLFLRRAT